MTALDKLGLDWTDARTDANTSAFLELLSEPKNVYLIQMKFCQGLKSPRKTADIQPECRIVDTVAEDCPDIILR